MKAHLLRLRIRLTQTPNLEILSTKIGRIRRSLRRRDWAMPSVGLAAPRVDIRPVRLLRVLYVYTHIHIASRWRSTRPSARQIRPISLLTFWVLEGLPRALS